MGPGSAPVASGVRRGGRHVLLALVLGGVHGPALPQALAVEEVVVTARKVVEPLADVPLSIEVIASDRLGSGAFDGLRSLAADVPGLYFESMWGGSNAAAILRGQSSPSAAGDNVGVFVDGVYQAARSAIDVEALDIERVEVVRGPQSTMFGHSTFAGAIHYVSREPTNELESGAALEAGSDEYVGARGFLSGPLAGALLVGRLATSARSFAGTGVNDAAPDESLGGFRRKAVTGTLATAGDRKWSATLSGRMTRVELAHPAVRPLTYPDYDCGSRDPVSGAWSYYCGRFPEEGRTEVSPGIRDSHSEAWQAALGIAWQLDGVEVRSDTSAYRAHAERLRDFDGLAGGDIFGVCTLGENCSGPVGVPRPVNRLVLVNEVQAQWPEVEEFSQEVRASGRGWMLGLAAYVTHELERTGFGADGSGLGPSERLTAYLPASPFIAGPLSNFNRALVADPNAMQVEQSKTRTTHHVLGLFGALEREVSARFRLRGELRANFERIAIDNVTANYLPGFGEAIEPLDFFDLTPRFSVEHRRDGETVAYASAARGSRSGGINAIPGLLPGEQGYDPETNWTYELSGRLPAEDGRLHASATVFYVDWDNAQITGFSNSPGVGNLITLNTGGVTTRGLELSVDLGLPRGLELGLDCAYADPRFRGGSDDPGSTRFCGLGGSSTTSTFCVVGPARHPATGVAPLVPYVDGNRLQRAPANSWRVTLSLPQAALGGGWELAGRIEGYGQDDVFDRAIGGARYGARTLLDARLGIARGDWSLELWGLNLAGEDYVAAAASRGAAYFPTTPRPLDLIHGPGRRFGLTVRYGD